MLIDKSGKQIPHWQEVGGMLWYILETDEHAFRFVRFSSTNPEKQVDTLQTLLYDGGGPELSWGVNTLKLIAGL